MVERGSSFILNQNGVLFERYPIYIGTNWEGYKWLHAG